MALSAPSPRTSFFFPGLLSVWLLLQTVLVILGSRIRQTETLFHLDRWLLLFTLLIGLSCLAQRLLAGESGLPTGRRERFLLALVVWLPLFFSPVSTVAFVTPKYFLLGAFALLLLWTGILPGYPLRTADQPWLFFLIVLGAGALRFPDLPAQLAVALPMLGVWGACAILARAAQELPDGVVLRLTDALLASSLIPSLYALIQHYGLDGSGVFQNPGGRAQVFATLGNVNWLGIYLAALLPLFVVRFRLASSGTGLAVIWLAGHLAAVALLFTRSRSAWLAAIIGLAWPLLVRLRSGVRPPLHPLPAGRRLLCYEPLVLLLLLAVLSLPAVTGFGLTGRIREAFQTDYNVSQRLHVWRIALDLFRQRPLLGNGTGSFSRDFLDAQAQRLANETDEARLRLGGNAREAHNEYLQFLAENGLLGLGAFFALLLPFLRRLPPPGPREHPRDFWLKTGWSGLLAAILCDACFSFPLQLPVTGALFALGLGLLLRPAPDAASGEGDGGWMARALALALSCLLLLVVAADTMTAIGGDRMKYQRLGEGRQWLEGALALQPWRGDSLFLLGTALQSLGEYDSAEALLHRARRFTNDKGIATNLAFLLHRNGEDTEAARLFRQAWLYEPRSCEAATNLALHHIQRAETAEAELFLARALRENPNYPPAWNERGFLHLRRGEAEQAAESFDRILTRNPAELAEANFRHRVYLYTRPITLHAEYAKAWYGKGRAELLAGRRAQAEEAYRQSLRFQADNPLVQYQLALLLVETGRFHDAKPLLHAVAGTRGPWAGAARRLLNTLERSSPR